ncbi:MAG: hypothetical protein BRC46_00725 [Cyanobacteria bacterium QS_6_48_18]|nr:MAG: hypothetical protein BRC46_00725 [Cyanobacteria bacterium QS_6_48_18]
MVPSRFSFSIPSAVVLLLMIATLARRSRFWMSAIAARLAIGLTWAWAAILGSCFRGDGTKL